MLSQFETFLETMIKNTGESKTMEAMSYSLLGGGKRLRPRLVFSLAKDLGVDVPVSFPLAMALEMVHTYSLVHDDLPSMDNDDFRRHKPTNHKVFGEGQAILAGDALLTYAFQVISEAEQLNDSQKIAAILSLSKNSGPRGMILGQEIDTEDKIESIDDLNKCYELKTGCLFACAFEMAVISAQRFDLIEVAHQLGLKLGLVFQYQDDILEATSTFETLGKSAESDAIRDKSTIVSFLGLENAKLETSKLFESIEGLISKLGNDNLELNKVIESMVQRTF